MTTRPIEITNVGPLHRLSIPVPDSGGVVVLRGKNGAGKTRALDAVETLVSKRGEVETSRGAVSAAVSAFGATLRVGRRLNRSGELEVSSLEGKFSIADLVDPKIKDPLAADARRIKALIQLSSQSKADPAEFYELAGGREEFDRYVSREAIVADDLVVMAARIKADFEKAARKLEDDVKTLRVQAESNRAAAAGVNVTQEDDSELLSDRLEDAIRTESRLRAERAAYLLAVNRTKEAQAALDASQSEGEGVSVSEAQLALDRATEEVHRTTTEVDRIREELRTAEAKALEAKHSYELSQRTLREAESHIRNLETLRQLVDTPLPIKVLEEEIDQAANDVSVARLHVEHGALIRQAKQQIQKAEDLSSSADELEEKGNKLRNAAQSTDIVLSKAVQKLGCPLYVSQGRLATVTERGEESFASLSRGQQYSLAIGIGVKAVGRGGVIVLPQEAWEGLDPDNKRLVASQVEQTGVVILTAEQSSDEDIVSETFSSGEFAL
jgi:energy-coupling factor transporter ATP-binding protein EcfA2